MGRKSDGVISLTSGDLERSDQGHLLKITIYVRDCAIVTIEHLLLFIDRKSMAQSVRPLVTLKGQIKVIGC